MAYRRHGLILPPPQEALFHSPTWSRGTPPIFRDGSPVTLVMALEEEPAHHHQAMILAHVEVLQSLALLAKERRGAGDASLLTDLESRSVGYNLVLFGGELASAMFNRPYALTVAPPVRHQAVETVTFATLLAAGCLGSAITEHRQTLS